MVQGGVVEVTSHPLKGGVKPWVREGGDFMENRPNLQDGICWNYYLVLDTSINVLVLSHQQASVRVNFEVA